MKTKLLNHWNLELANLQALILTSKYIDWKIWHVFPTNVNLYTRTTKTIEHTFNGYLERFFFICNETFYLKWSLSFSFPFDLNQCWHILNTNKYNLSLVWICWTYIYYWRGSIMSCILKYKTEVRDTYSFISFKVRTFPRYALR